MDGEEVWLGGVGGEEDGGEGIGGGGVLRCGASHACNSKVRQITVRIRSKLFISIICFAVVMDIFEEV